MFTSEFLWSRSLGTTGGQGLPAAEQETLVNIGQWRCNVYIFPSIINYLSDVSVHAQVCHYHSR